MTRHHAIVLVLALVACGLCMFFGFCWGKSRGTHLDGSPLGIWIGGAASAFIGGFWEGAPRSAVRWVGGIAIADHQAFASLGLMHIMILAAHVLAVPVVTGLSDIRTLHVKEASPFPERL